MVPLVANAYCWYSSVTMGYHCSVSNIIDGYQWKNSERIQCQQVTRGRYIVDSGSLLNNNKPLSHERLMIFYTWSCPTLGLACVLMLRPISHQLVLFPDFWVSKIPWYFCFALKFGHIQWLSPQMRFYTNSCHIGLLPNLERFLFGIFDRFDVPIRDAKVLWDIFTRPVWVFYMLYLLINLFPKLIIIFRTLLFKNP